jgi:hypothetical protein
VSCINRRWCLDDRIRILHRVFMPVDHLTGVPTRDIMIKLCAPVGIAHVQQCLAIIQIYGCDIEIARDKRAQHQEPPPQRASARLPRDKSLREARSSRWPRPMPDVVELRFENLARTLFDTLVKCTSEGCRLQQLQVAASSAAATTQLACAAGFTACHASSNFQLPLPIPRFRVQILNSQFQLPVSIQLRSERLRVQVPMFSVTHVGMALALDDDATCSVHLASSPVWLSLSPASYWHTIETCTGARRAPAPG